MKQEYNSREHMYETVGYVYMHQKTETIFEILNKIFFLIPKKTP